MTKQQLIGAYNQKAEREMLLNEVKRLRAEKAFLLCTLQDVEYHLDDFLTDDPSRSPLDAKRQIEATYRQVRAVLEKER